MQREKKREEFAMIKVFMKNSGKMIDQTLDLIRLDHARDVPQRRKTNFLEINSQGQKLRLKKLQLKSQF